MRRFAPLLWVALAAFALEATLVSAFAVSHWAQLGPRLASYRLADDLRR